MLAYDTLSTVLMMLSMTAVAAPSNAESAERISD